MTPSTFSTLALFSASLLVAVAAAPAAEVSPSTVDNGGVTSAGGTYEVTGSIGQLDGGEMSGGSFALSGGFWSSTHPFVPVELQSFEVVGGAVPARPRGLGGGPGEPDRALAEAMSGSPAAITNPVPPEPEEDPADDPEPSHTTH